MALVTADGGNGYWNPHPGDDPMAMVMTSWSRAASALAYASAAAFTAANAVTHAAALGRRPVRVASGYADPFRPGVQALARALPGGSGDGVRPGVPR